MKHTILITDTPRSDFELIAAAALIIKEPGIPLDAKARALRDLSSFSAQLGQHEARNFGRNDNRTPVIKPPLDPEPGYDQEHRLVWRTGPKTPKPQNPKTPRVLICFVLKLS